VVSDPNGHDELPRGLVRVREQAAAEAADRRHADRQRDGTEWPAIKTLSTVGLRLSTVADAHPRAARIA
jgi:hypothetical protein